MIKSLKIMYNIDMKLKSYDNHPRKRVGGYDNHPRKSVGGHDNHPRKSVVLIIDI
jgi:hypothetical protein